VHEDKKFRDFILIGTSQKVLVKDERRTSNVKRRMKNKPPMANIFSHLTFDIELRGFAPTAGTKAEISIQLTQMFH